MLNVKAQSSNQVQIRNDSMNPDIQSFVIHLTFEL
jgi:hypothetical protein